jgi:glycosyltransferase involved in cell wall biosynthesis
MQSQIRRDKKIAMVIGQLTQGGAEKQLVLLAKQLQRIGEVEPVVFCTSSFTEPYGAVLDDMGVQWFCPSENTKGSLRRLIWLRDRIQAIDCSLIYGVLNIGNIYGDVVSLLLGLPLVTSIRSANSGLPFWIRLFSGVACQHARIVIANSRSCVDSLRKDLNVHHDRVRIVPNAVNLELSTSKGRDRVRRDWGIDEAAIVVGTVANIKPEKRAGFFIDIASALRRSNGKPVHYVWIGAGYEDDRIELRLADQPKLEARVHFPGARRDIINCLRAFDLFVLTSAYEGMPNALLEAMASGLPCVVTDVPGSRDVLLGGGGKEIGLLADPVDPLAFAGAVRMLLRDEERMTRMGRNAARHVREHYTVEAMVDAYSEVFRDVMESRN